MAITHKDSDVEIVQAQQAAMLELLPLFVQPENAKYQYALKTALIHLVHKVEQIIRSEQIDMIAGRCDVRHGDKTFQDFIEMGGDECPICMKRKLEEAKQKIKHLEVNFGALNRVSEARIAVLQESLRVAEKNLRNLTIQGEGSK